MSLALALIATVAAQVPADEDILVIAKRLDSISASVTRGADGKFQCGLSRSTGLPRLDESLCRTATKCVRGGANTAEAVDACVSARKPALLDEVRAQLKAGKA